MVKDGEDNIATKLHFSRKYEELKTNFRLFFINQFILETKKLLTNIYLGIIIS